jgi:hypothetical protein
MEWHLRMEGSPVRFNPLKTADLDPLDEPTFA